MTSYLRVFQHLDFMVSLHLLFRATHVQNLHSGLARHFLCLHLPADHPFWTATENNGTWETLGSKGTKVTSLNGPALCFSNHQANGETILRTGKVVKNKKDEHGMWNYSKLCFNTKYPWESAVAPDIEAQQYVLYDGVSDEIKKGNVT